MSTNPSFKAPKRVVFVDVVPRAPNGQADYATARRLARTSDGDDANAAPGTTGHSSAAGRAG